MRSRPEQEERGMADRDVSELVTESVGGGREAPAADVPDLVSAPLTRYTREIEALFQSTQQVLREWIDRLGAESEHEFPKKVTAFREGMAVHGRYQQPCPVCGIHIQRIKYADNECDYCPECQTGGKLLADRGLSRLLKTDWPRSLSELEELKSRHTSS